MISAITSIEIHNPYGNVYYANADKSSAEFPITDQCERSAKVMGEDFVRLQFKLKDRVTFDAFSFIEYDNQTFFLREQYIPTPNGTYYTYDVKFVSVANMLDKHVCYRHVKVTGAGEWYEPEININGTLDTMYVIVMGSIQRAAEQFKDIVYGQLLSTIYTNGMASDGINPNYSKVKITANTDLLTFNFSGDNIANVCTTIANKYTNDNKKDTEWYITEEHDTNPYLRQLTLHFAKCQGDESQLQEFSDYVSKDNGAYAFAHPYTTGGLRKVEYAQAWSGITNVIIPYGSDRNMAGQSVKGIDDITKLQSTFGKRLRLEIYDKEGNPKTYKVIDKDGKEQEITINEQGGIRNDFVNTGIEQVKFFDEVYPQAHFQVKEVTTKNKRQDGQIVPEYTIHAVALNNEGKEISTALLPDGFFPLQIEEGTTLSVRFESGLLNGREFEIANKTKSEVVEIKGEEKREYSLIFTIVADGSIEDGTLIPSGNFTPHIGDKFALFNMKMPDVYIELAQQALAQKAYEELVKIQTTRPEVKCSSDPTNFNGQMALGGMVAIRSELFNSEGDEFKSRIISYSYKLTKTTDVQFSLASAIMQGTLSTMNDLIADVTHATGGLDQRTINLSRRAWRDATEMAEMLDSLKAEMLLVGEEKFQFAFSSAIQCVHENNAFVGLEVSAGTMQHTQEPYINYSNGGFWGIGYVLLYQDEAGNPLKADTPYYVYAKVEDKEYAEIVLNENAYSNEIGKDEPYLMLGILSSEFEGERIFNRTNGFTQIVGGTITTEQVQDAGRNLIIDFQRAEIIARGGAKISGNIEFELKDWQIEDIKNKLNIDTSAFDYLIKALENNTDISGGLISTTQILLRDKVGEDAEGNAIYEVNAGLSGLEEDNILAFGGGTYEDAVNASKSGNYEKKDGKPITTLIKKDGTCKIGVTRIDEDSIRVVTNSQTTIITNKNIEDVVTFQSDFEEQNSKTLSANITGTKENEVDSNEFGSLSSYTTLEHFTLNDVSAGQYNLNGILSVVNQTASGWCAYVEEDYQEETDHENYKGSVVSIVKDLRIRVVQNNTEKAVLYSKCSQTKRSHFWYNYQSERDDTELEGGNLSQTTSLTLSAGDVHIYVEAVAYGEAYFPANNRDYQYRTNVSVEFAYSVELKCLDKYSVIARDGIAIIANSNSGFYVNNDTDNIKVIVRGLPINRKDDINTLPTGSLYIDEDFVKIKKQ